MPYELKTKTLTVSTVDTELYKCGGDNSIVFGLSLTNNLASDITINITFYSDSGGNTTDIVAPNTVLSVGETLVPIGGVQKIVMKSNDKIMVRCSSSNGMDAICSAMELTDYTS